MKKIILLSMILTGQTLFAETLMTCTSNGPGIGSLEIDSKGFIEIKSEDVEASPRIFKITDGKNDFVNGVAKNESFTLTAQDINQPSEVVGGATENAILVRVTNIEDKTMGGVIARLALDGTVFKISCSKN